MIFFWLFFGLCVVLDCVRIHNRKSDDSLSILGGKAVKVCYFRKVSRKMAAGVYYFEKIPTRSQLNLIGYDECVDIFVSNCYPM